MENLLAPQQQPNSPDSATNDAILAALDILYQPDVIESVTEMLAAASNPAKQAGDLAAKLVIQANEANGGSFGEEVIVPAAAALLDELLGYAEEATQYQPRPKDDEVAAMSMMDALLQAYPVSEHDYNTFTSSLTDEALPDSINSMAAAAGNAQQGGANV